MDDDDLTTRVRTAHGDAWQAEGLMRVADGGGAAELPGIRLMASGLPHPQWNNGDVTDPSAVDVGAVAAWYAARALPWGVRVPAGEPWADGDLVMSKRLMGLPRSRFTPPPPSGGPVYRPGPAGIEDVVAFYLVRFGGDPDLERRWLAPHLEHDIADLALAGAEGEPRAGGYTVRTSGPAGDCVYLSGLCFDEESVGSAVLGDLLARAFTGGAQLAHAHPDDDREAAALAGLGFVEVSGFDVYVMG